MNEAAHVAAESGLWSPGLALATLAVLLVPAALLLVWRGK